jgi:hypothetical protein
MYSSPLLAGGPEAVEAGGRRDQPIIAGLVEVMPRRPGQPAPAWRLGIACRIGVVAGQRNSPRITISFAVIIVRQARHLADLAEPCAEIPDEPVH